MENDMKTNENLKLIKIYLDQEKTKLWYEYHVDQFGKNRGEYKNWYFNGQISVISNYKDGRWHGKRQLWCEDGRRTHFETHHFKKNDKHGTKIEFKYQ